MVIPLFHFFPSHKETLQNRQNQKILQNIIVDNIEKQDHHIIKECINSLKQLKRFNEK